MKKNNLMLGIAFILLALALVGGNYFLNSSSETLKGSAEETVAATTVNVPNSNVGNFNENLAP